MDILQKGTTVSIADPKPVLIQDNAPSAFQSTFSTEKEATPLNIPLPDQPDAPTTTEAFGAGLLELTVAGRLFQPFAFDDSFYNPMPGYEAAPNRIKAESAQGYMFNEDARKYLDNAVSPENFDVRLQQIIAQEQRQKALSSNPIGYAAALADLDILFGAAGAGAKLVGAGRIGSAATGAAVSTTMGLVPNVNTTAVDHVFDAVGGAVAGVMSNIAKIDPNTGKVIIDPAVAAKVNARTKKKMKDQAPTDNSVYLEHPEGVKPEFKSKPNDTPTFWNGVAGGVKKLQSLWDEVSTLGPKAMALANKTIGKAFDSKSYSAAGAAYQRNFMLDTAVMLAHMEDVMTKLGLFDPNSSMKAYSPARRAELLAQREQVGIDVQVWLNKAWRADRAGEASIPLPQDPIVRKVIEELHKTQHAEMMLRRAKEAGVEGAEEIIASKNYHPLVWNWNKIEALANRLNKYLTPEGRKRLAEMRKQGREDSIWAKIDENPGYQHIARAFGTQIVRQFGTFSAVEAEAFGMQFLKNLQGDRTGNLALKLRDWEVNGLTREEAVNILRAGGMAESEVLANVDRLFGTPNVNSVGDVAKSLRHRMDWDLEEVFYTADDNATFAEGFTLADMIEPDILKTKERYAMEMTSRIGLAQAGITSGTKLQNALDEIVDEAIANGYSPKDARAVADHFREVLLGRPIGEDVPDFVRTLNAMATSWTLGNSGIYNIGEYANLAAEYGYVETAKQFLKTLGRDTLNKLNASEWSELSDIITGKLVADGRFQPVVRFLEDNFESTVGGFQELTQFAAQSVRFLNGSEYVRRQQINMFAGLYQNTLEKAFKGDAKAKAILFERQGLSAEDFDEFLNEYKAAGLDTRLWNLETLDKLTTHAIATSDQLVTAIRKGDRPRLMESTLGKVIFPYMSFTWAAHNKILRRHYNRDGVLGVATIMLHQAPLAFLAAGAANVAAGKPWDSDFTNGMPKAMSSTGLFSIPWDFINRGRMGSGYTGFTPFNNIYKLATGPEDLHSFNKAVPGAAVFLPANLLLGGIKQGNE